MSKGERYRSGHHLPRVKESAKVRMGSWQVLSALCDRSEYDRPEVTITKHQIHKICGLERKAIQRGLAHLRKIGVIVPLEGFAGGRGVATTYRLVDIGQGGETRPEEGGADDFPTFKEWNEAQGSVRRSYSDYIAEKRQYENRKKK